MRTAALCKSSHLINRPVLAGKAAVALMADDMRPFVVNEGHVEEKTMILLGWTAAQLTAHGPAAAALQRKLAA